MPKSLETIEQNLQALLQEGKENLAIAQETYHLQDAVGTESAMLNDADIAKSFETLAALKQRYAKQLAKMGGVDGVLKNLEEYILHEKLRDPRFATDPQYKQTQREDFIRGKEGAEDNLTERGRYKAALRALKDELPVIQRSQLSEEEAKLVEIHFGSVFHPHSKKTIGPKLLGEKQWHAREILAYFWLAASDKDMPLSEDSLLKAGSRENCIKFEQTSLINALASYQRTHNDGIYAHTDRLLDNPSCEPGAWGRFFQEAPFYNELTKPYKAEKVARLTLDNKAFSLDVNTHILQQLKALSPQQKCELLNNYNACYTQKTSDPNRVVGYNIDTFFKDLQQNFKENKKNYWENFAKENPTIKEIINRTLRHDNTYERYTTALQSCRMIYEASWELEMARIAQGLLHQQAFYEPFERDVFETILRVPHQKANQALLSHVENEKQKLEIVTAALSTLRKRIDSLSLSLKSKEDITARRAALKKLSTNFQRLVEEKNTILASILKTGRTLALSGLLSESMLLQTTKDESAITQIVYSIFPAEHLAPLTEPIPEAEVIEQPSLPTPTQKLMFDNKYKQLNENWDNKTLGEKTPQKLFDEALKVFVGKPAFLQMNEAQINWLKVEKGLPLAERQAPQVSMQPPKQKILLKDVQAQVKKESAEIEAHYQSLLNAVPEKESTLTLTDQEENYLYQVHHFYINWEASWGERDFGAIEQKSYETVQESYSDEVAVVLSDEAFLLGKQKLWLLSATDLLEQGDSAKIELGIQFLNLAAENNNVTARNRLHQKKILTFIKEQEKFVLEAKVKLHAALSSPEWLELTNFYFNQLTQAADLGSELAKLTLLKLCLNSEEAFGLEIIDDPKVLALLSKSAQDFYAKEDQYLDVLTNTLIKISHSQDPRIRAEAEILKRLLAQKVYNQLIETKRFYKAENVNNVLPIHILLNAAQLGHPLAQMEILALLAKEQTYNVTSESYKQYKLIFGGNTVPDIHSLFSQAQILFTKLPTQKEKDDAEQYFRIIKEKYVENIRHQITYHLREAEKAKDAGVQAEVIIHIKHTKILMHRLKVRGIILDFPFSIQHLNSFRDTMLHLKINPKWLVELCAQLEDDEQSIRLTTGAIQYQLQKQRNEDILERVKIFLISNRNFDVLENATHQYSACESTYYELLNQQNISKVRLNSLLEQLISKKNNLNAAINRLISDFQHTMAVDNLNEQDSEFIDRLFRESESRDNPNDTLASLPRYQKIIEANEHIKRCNFIIESHNKNTNILSETQNALTALLSEFRAEIRVAKNQVAQSIDPSKDSIAARQFKILTKAEQRLNVLQMDIQSKTDKGMPYYLAVAERITHISGMLSRELQTVGTLGAVSLAMNKAHANMNTMLKQVHVQHQFKINTALTKEQKLELTKKSVAVSEVIPGKTPADLSHHIKLTFSDKKKSEAVLSYTPHELELARKYINTHLNVKELSISKTGFEGNRLKDYLAEVEKHLHSGVYAEITQATREPITLTFRSLDGNRALAVEVTKYTFDQYIAKEKSHEPESLNKAKRQ